MNKTEIYYISGTGNSMHVAKELKSRLSDSVLIPIVKLDNGEMIKTESDTIGFVFPIHLSTLPMVVKETIERMDLQSVKYIFAIATRIGTQHSAFYLINKALKNKGKKLNAHFNLNMPSNDPKFKYKPLADEEIKKLEAVAQSELDVITKTIANKETSLNKDTTYTARIPFVNALATLVALTENIKQKFYADEKCGGCGTCEKVCLSKKIKMVNGRPMWQESVKCYKCYACLNFCPQKAIQLKGYTEKNDRYSHPYATAEDIAVQK